MLDGSKLREGSRDGCWDGLLLTEGSNEGIVEGSLEGWCDGLMLADGFCDGLDEGT